MHNRYIGRREYSYIAQKKRKKQNMIDLLNIPVDTSQLPEIEQVVKEQPELLNSLLNGERSAGKNKETLPVNINIGNGQENTFNNPPKNTKGKDYILQQSQIVRTSPQEQTQEQTTSAKWDYEKDINPYVERGMGEYEKQTAPLYDKQKELLARINEIQQKYDITRVPEKEKDARLNGLLMLANAITHLGGVIGETKGDAKGGNRGMVPLRYNKDFEGMYNRYLQGNDEVKQAKASEKQREMQLLLDKIKGENEIEQNKLKTGIAERQRLINEAKNLYGTKKVTTKISGKEQRQDVWQDPDTYAKPQASQRIIASRGGGGVSREKGNTKGYRITSWSYKQPRWKLTKETLGLPATEVGAYIYSNKDFELDETDTRKFYSFISDYIKELYKLQGRKWQRATKTSDMAGQINELAEYVNTNTDKENQSFITRAFVGMNSKLEDCIDNVRKKNYYNYSKDKR